jgi:hypothetical protein
MAMGLCHKRNSLWASQNLQRLLEKFSSQNTTFLLPRQFFLCGICLVPSCFGNSKTGTSSLLSIFVWYVSHFAIGKKCSFIFLLTHSDFKDMFQIVAFLFYWVLSFLLTLQDNTDHGGLGRLCARHTGGAVFCIFLYIRWVGSLGNGA